MKSILNFPVKRIFKFFFVLVSLLSLPFYNFAQTTVPLYETFDKDAVIEIQDYYTRTCEQFVINGSIQLFGPKSIVRLLVVTEDNTEYLVAEAYPLICSDTYFQLYDYGEESKYLPERTKIICLKIYIENANITIDNFKISNIKYKNYEQTAYNHKEFIANQKVTNANAKLANEDMLWRARITNYALLPYANRAKYFPDNKYFTDGYEFYGGGIFSDFSSKSGYGEVPQLPQLDYIETPIDSGYVKASYFDWREAHDANNPSSFYFDNNPDSVYYWSNNQLNLYVEQGNGWLTSVKQQTTYSGGINSFIYPSTRVCPNGCFIYGPTSATEACFNLYSNAHHNYDFSEQYLMELGYNATNDKYVGGTCINNYVNRVFPYDTLINEGDFCFLTDTFYTYSLHILDSVLFIATSDISIVFDGDLNDLQITQYDSVNKIYTHRDTIYVGLDYIIYDNQLIKPNYNSGGIVAKIMQRIRDYGAVNESFLPWQDTLLFGDTIYENQQLEYRVKIDDYISNLKSENDVKWFLINNGPTAGTPRMGHACTLVGFGIVTPGDTIDLDGGWGNNQKVVQMFHPFIGQTYWIFKEQNGIGFGEGGYVKILIGEMYNNYGFPNTYFVKKNVYDTENSISIPVYDADGDGYCFWGLGDKPEGCDTCPNIPDCNDNNPFLHHYDGNMRCMPDCDSLALLTSEIPPVIISDTTIKNGFILYDITVDNNTMLTLEGEIFINNNVKITVNHGSTLYLKGAHLQSYCGNKWKGIILNGNRDSSIGITGYSMLMASGAVLEDAETAITGDVGAIVNAQGCTFRFNKFDVVLKPFVFSSYSSQVNNISNAKFINCKFYTFNDTTINYEISNVGLICVKGVQFKNCHFKDWRVDDDDTFSRAGIVCLGSGCKVYTTESGIPSSFENMQYGIYSQSNHFLPLEIENYNFINCLRGIYLNDSYNAYIVNNTFNIPNRDEIPDEIPYGIYMDVCKNFRIENNTLTVERRSTQQIHYATPCETFAGIITKDCSESTDEIYRNYFCKNATAVQAIGENKDYNEDEYGVSVTCNDFDNNTYDIFVTADIDNPYADTLNTGIAQYQGSDNFPAGNLFTDSIYEELSFITINWGDFTNIYNDAEFFNYYYNDTTGYPRVYPLHVAGSGVVNLIWTSTPFSQDSTCPDRTIDTTGGGGIGGGVIKSAQLKTSINYYSSQLANLTDGGNTELTIAEIVLANDYTAWQTYLSLMNKSPYLSDEALKEVAAKEEGLTAPMVRDVLVANPQAAKSNEVQAILNERIEELPAYMIEQINSGLTNISPREFLEMRKAECTAEYSRIINNRIRYIAKTPGLSLQDSVEYYLNSLDIPVFHYMLSDFYASMGDYNSAIAELNNIDYTGIEIPLRIQESTAFYTMLFQWQTDSVNLMALDSSKLQMLEYYETGHPAVAAKARSLLFLNNACDYEEPIYYPSQITSRKMRVSNEAEKETGYFNVYPNPATDFVQVSWKTNDNIEAIGITISNALGNYLINKSISGKENTIIISLKEFTQGIYLCTIHYSDGTSETQKFTLIK